MLNFNQLSSWLLDTGKQLWDCTIVPKRYVALLLFSIVAFRGVTQAQFSCPDPSRCVSQDLQVVDAYIEGVDQCFTCTTGETVTKNLIVKIYNKTGSTRTSFAVFANLSGGTFVSASPGGASGTSISFCDGPIPPNTTVTTIAGTITFKCGDVLKLTDVFEAWTSAAETHNSCAEILADKCASIAPKCGTLSEIVIRTPLSLSVTKFQAACVGKTDGSITVAATGGTAPYSYTISGGTLSSDVTNTTGVFTGLGKGSYTITVTDAKGCKKTITYNLGDKVCCEFKVTCPTSNNLGSFTCKTLANIPAQPTTVSALSAAPYNIIIGPNPCGVIAFKVSDNGTPNACSKANQTITRTITIWDDLNKNGTLDTGEPSQTCTFTYTIEADLTAPTITCPAAVTVQCDKDVPAPDVTKVTATDNCSTPTVTFVSDVASGTCPKVITRTYKATDACGNSSTCTQTITVKDITPPVITCAPNKTIYCPATVAFTTPTATDNCGGTVTITIVSTVTNGDVTTRTWKATDACGNSSTCSQSITLKNVSHIFPTNTSCSDFTSGTAQPLSKVCYTTKGTSSIFNAVPGVFFYYTTIVAPSSSFCVDVNQTACNNFKYFSLLQNQLIAWNYSNCTKLTYTVSQTTAGQYRICISGVTTGQKIVLSAKYNVKSIIGSPVGTSSPNCTYTFTSSINGVVDPCSKGSILVTANCTSSSLITQNTLGNDVNLDKVEETTSGLNVTATPNPFYTRIRFEIHSPVSGQGQLDLYNVLGQKMQSVYQGYIEAGKTKTVEYSVPSALRTDLIYRMSVGTHSATGKLIQAPR